MKALVVDDSRAMRAIIGRSLAAAGCEIVEAEDGEAGLTLLKQGPPPDLVVVDIHMPRMDGLEFVRRVRSDDSFEGIRILVASSDCDLQTVTKVLLAGADEYLMKPFDDAAVAEKIALMGLKEPQP